MSKQALRDAADQMPRDEQLALIAIDVGRMAKGRHTTNRAINALKSKGLIVFAPMGECYHLTTAGEAMIMEL